MRNLLLSLLALTACHHAPAVTPAPVPPEPLASAGSVDMGARGVIRIGRQPPLPADYRIPESLCYGHRPVCDTTVVLYYNVLPAGDRSQVQVRIGRDSVVDMITTEFVESASLDSVLAEYVTLLGPPDTVRVREEARIAHWTRGGWLLSVGQRNTRGAVASWMGRAPIRTHPRRALTDIARSNREWLWLHCMELALEQCSLW